MDIYNHDLKQWLFNPFADTYMENAMEYPCGFYEKIAYAQHLALLDIYSQVMAGLEDLLDD